MQDASALAAEVAELRAANAVLEARLERQRAESAAEMDAALEELREAWRFESTESRAFADALAARAAAAEEGLRNLSAAYGAHVEGEEEYHRGRAEAEEAREAAALRAAEEAERRLVRFDAIAAPFLHEDTDHYFGRRVGPRSGALVKTWEALRGEGLSPEEWRHVLKAAARITEVNYYVEGGDKPRADDYTITKETLAEFAPTVLCRMPALHKVFLAGVHTLELYVRPWAPLLPPSVVGLYVSWDCPYEVPTLFDILRERPTLQHLCVSAQVDKCCRGWGEFAPGDKDAVEKASGGRISFC